MTNGVTRRALLGGALALSVARPAQSAKLERVKVTEAAQVPVIRPDWPIPGEPHQLFYIQRSTNSNTIVYTARYNKAGALDARKPAQAYWRRFNTTGERMALRPFERRFAFGMKIREFDNAGEWIVNAVAAPQFPMRLRQTGPFEAQVLTSIGGRNAHPVYCFIDVDEAGVLPRVTGMSMHGVDAATGRAISEVFRISGGQFRE